MQLMQTHDYARCQVLVHTHVFIDFFLFCSFQMCRAVRTVCMALKRFLHTFVQFPGHKPVRVIKEEFHRVAGTLSESLSSTSIK